MEDESERSLNRSCISAEEVTFGAIPWWKTIQLLPALPLFSSIKLLLS